MTIGELIQLPPKLSPDPHVAVNGYENGYDDVSHEQLSVVRIALNSGKHRWDG